MEIVKLLGRPASFTRRRRWLVLSADAISGNRVAERTFSSGSEDAELKDFMAYLDSLKNYEKSGVPRGAGTDSDEGFDLGRMRRLMELLGNPQSKFKAVHIAGTKGKGSTSAFVSNILRAEGYSVGCYTSPHIQTIRERMSIGRSGEPVSAKILNDLFQRMKPVVDQAIGLEKGHISHFEVLTATAFTLFAQENVDIAVIEAGLGGARDATNIIDSSKLAASVITTIGEEHLDALGGSLESIAIAKSGIIKHHSPLILGGPFLPHIESILREKASSTQSPVLSASDPGIKSIIRGHSVLNGTPCQSCDILIQVEKDFPLLIELLNVNLRMLGRHQLQNAATATLVALCLRDQGWRISDDSIMAGLEKTFMLGRSHFLTSKEAEALGLPGAMILLDGAHTKESAKALIDMIDVAFPEARLALVVAMATDKDHVGFAKELLSGKHLEAVFLTEANIAGGSSRTASASTLRDCWIQAAKELSIEVLHNETADQFASPSTDSDPKTILTIDNSFTSSLQAANRVLRERSGNQPCIVVVTGSLHLTSLVLGSLHSKIQPL